MNSSLNSECEKIFKKNYALFKNRFSQFAAIISQEKAFELALEAKEKVEILSAKDGNIVCKQNGKAFHSVYAPQKESENLAKSEKFSKNSVTVLLSWGLGYLANEFCKIHSEKTLVIIESDLPFAFLPFLFTDLTNVFLHEKLILLFGLDQSEIIGFFENQRIEEFNLFRNASQSSHNEAWFNQLQSLFERNKEKIQINRNTTKKFGKLWIKNECHNLEISKNASSIKCLENKFCDFPFLIIGAGPSLNDSIEKIKKIQNNFITICVDTALNQCLKNGIQPDFVVLMDCQYWNARHLDFAKTQNSILLCESSVYPSVFNFQHKWKKVLLCESQYPLGKILQNGCNFGKLSSGGSVATTAWDFARFLGAKQIFLIGVDLAFVENQTHAKNSTFEKWAQIFSTRLDTSDTKSVGSIFSANSILQTNYEGNLVKTDSRMKMYAWWFESKASEFTKIKTYNLSSKALKIPGIDYFDFDKLISMQSSKIAASQAISQRMQSCETLCRTQSSETSNKVQSCETLCRVQSSELSSGNENAKIIQKNLQNLLAYLENPKNNATCKIDEKLVDDLALIFDGDKTKLKNFIEKQILH